MKRTGGDIRTAPAQILVLFFLFCLHVDAQHNSRHLGEAEDIEDISHTFEETYSKLVNYATVGDDSTWTQPMHIRIEPEDQCHVVLRAKNYHTTLDVELDFGTLDPTSFRSSSVRVDVGMFPGLTPASKPAAAVLTVRTTDAELAIREKRTVQPELTTSRTPDEELFANSRRAVREVTVSEQQVQYFSVALFNDQDLKRVHKLLSYLIRKCGGVPSQFE